MKVTRLLGMSDRSPRTTWARLIASLLSCFCWALIGCNEPSTQLAPTTSPTPEVGSQNPVAKKQEPAADEAVPTTAPTLAVDATETAHDDQTMQFVPEQLKFGMVAIGTASEGCLGYGVVIDRSSTGFDVLTADHVLDGRKNLMVQAWQGAGPTAKLQPYLSVTVMHRSPDQDLAWVRVRGGATDLLPLSIVQSGDRDGQAVWTYQADKQQPIFEKHTVEKRVSAKRHDQSAAVSYWRLKNSIEPGLSGGGLVDAKGQWIGIASGNNKNQAHYVDPSEIIRFMKEAGLK